MAIHNTRIKDLDPLLADVIKYSIEQQDVNVIKVQNNFGISLQRAGAILDLGVDNGLLVQVDYFNYECNTTLPEFENFISKIK